MNCVRSHIFIRSWWKKCMVSGEILHSRMQTNDRQKRENKKTTSRKVPFHCPEESCFFLLLQFFSRFSFGSAFVVTAYMLHNLWVYLYAEIKGHLGDFSREVSLKTFLYNERKCHRLNADAIRKCGMSLLYIHTYTTITHTHTHKRAYESFTQLVQCCLKNGCCDHATSPIVQHDVCSRFRFCCRDPFSSPLLFFLSSNLHYPCHVRGDVHERETFSRIVE